MIKRVIWMSVGVLIGVIAVRKVTETKAALGPAGLNRAVNGLTDSLADFADAMRTGMRERETDLRTALGVEPPSAPERR